MAKAETTMQSTVVNCTLKTISLQPETMMQFSAMGGQEVVMYLRGKPPPTAEAGKYLYHLTVIF